MNNKLMNILQAILLAFVLAAEAAAVVFLFQLDMVPVMYMVLIAVLLLVFSVGIGLLMFLKNKDPEKKGIVRRVIACILAVGIIAGCGVVSHAAIKVKKMISAVTNPNKVSAVVCVYVLADDPASDLEAAKDYTFAAMTSFDTQGTQKAIAEIEKNLGQQISLEQYETAPALVNGLYNREVNAIILNTAYVTILEDIDIYADFLDKTKVLHEIIIYEEQKPTEPTAPSEETKPQPSTEPEKEIHVDPFIMYISGSDTRNQMLSVSRSDVNILVVVNPETKQILMINTPRDAYVPNPAGNGALDKLTHCGIYGIDCSVEALSQLYEHEIDHYAQINFTGFATLVDAVGGVTVYSDVAFTTSHGACQIQQGYNELNGIQALGFARERYALAGGDKDRGKNQMKLIAAIIDKLTSGTIITNYAQILESLEGMFMTDLSSDQISDLVKMQLSDMPKWEVYSFAITGKGASEETYSMPGRKLSVWWPNKDSVAHASQLITKVLDGELITEEDLTN